MPRKYLSARRFPPPFPIPSCPTHSLKLFSWLQPTELQMIRKWLNPSDVFNIKYSLFFIKKRHFETYHKNLERTIISQVYVFLWKIGHQLPNPLFNILYKTEGKAFQQQTWEKNLFQDNLFDNAEVWFTFPSSPCPLPYVNGDFFFSFTSSSQQTNLLNIAVISSVIFFSSLCISGANAVLWYMLVTGGTHSLSFYRI